MPGRLVSAKSGQRSVVRLASFVVCLTCQFAEPRDILRLVRPHREIMKRTINGLLVKRLRTEKGWSQEELAIASDLSARTIQRIETDGSGSRNSLKSIASALEVEMHNLEEKPRTHLVGVRWGYAGVAIGTASATIAILTNWLSGDGSVYEAGIGFGFVGLIAGVSAAFIGWASSKY